MLYTAKKMCLERGDYSFTIYDRSGDGLESCCGGYYNMTVDGKAIAIGGVFTFKETVSFSIPISEEILSTTPSASPSSSVAPSSSVHPSISPSLPPSLSPSSSLFPTMYCAGAWGVISILTDQFPTETRWTLSRVTTRGGASTNETVLEGNPDSSETLFTNETCLDDGNYIFVICDDYSDGISSPGYYEITVGRKIVARSGAFSGAEETILFSVPFTEK